MSTLDHKMLFQTVLSVIFPPAMELAIYSLPDEYLTTEFCPGIAFVLGNFQQHFERILIIPSRFSCFPRLPTNSEICTKRPELPKDPIFPSLMIALTWSFTHPPSRYLPLSNALSLFGQIQQDYFQPLFASQNCGNSEEDRLGLRDLSGIHFGAWGDSGGAGNSEEDRLRRIEFRLNVIHVCGTKFQSLSLTMIDKLHSEIAIEVD
jgi:hypothetical protein